MQSHGLLLDEASVRRWLSRGAAWIDVRAPCEWLRGFVPGAANLPLMTDDERRQVGICYRESGGPAALALGYRLVAGAERERRVDAWEDFATTGPQVGVYCAKGGLRSEIAVDWLRDRGRALPRVEGGYRTLRRVALTTLDEMPSNRVLVVVSGTTGSGKTEFLHQLAAPAIDLEGLAGHRGSAFGALPQPQPARATFENALAAELLRTDGAEAVFLEDESRWIGELRLPSALFRAMQLAPVVVLEATLAERVARIRRDYVEAPMRDGRDPVSLRDQLHDALRRIRRSLGGVLQDAAARMLDAAFASEDLGGHDRWIELLCREYYDAYYQRHLTRIADRVIARGTREELLAACLEPDLTGRIER